MARTTKSAKSSANRRAYKAIMNSAASLYPTRLTMRGDDICWECVKMGFQNRMTSSLVFVSEASKAL